MQIDDLQDTFNRVASLYAEIRPGYPDALIRDVIALSRIGGGGRILEVGCGTGQATQPFAEHGYEMICLDVGPDLIEIAKKRLRQFQNVRFELCRFEDWKHEYPFDLLICGTAFRWINRQVRYIKAAEVLRTEGAIAIFSNQHVRHTEGFFLKVQKIYKEHAPELHTDSHHPSLTRSAPPALEPGVKYFSEPLVRSYPWSQNYSSEEYVKLLNTYSDHIPLQDERRKSLFDGIRGLIDSQYGGVITKHYNSVLTFRTKKEMS